VFVDIVIGLCVASVLQKFRRHNNFFAVIMAINGHGQQQKNLATMEYIQGRSMCALWLIVVLVPIVIVLCVASALQMLH
jgi:hypothetical protein